MASHEVELRLNLQISLPQNGPTILVADDSDDTRQMLQVPPGWLRAIEYLRRADGENRPSRSIQQEGPGFGPASNLKLPRLSGLGVIRLLRNDLKLPILL